MRRCKHLRIRDHYSAVISISLLASLAPLPAPSLSLSFSLLASLVSFAREILSLFFVFAISPRSCLIFHHYKVIRNAFYSSTLTTTQVL